MKRCKHENCVVSEMWLMSLDHVFQDGEWQLEEHSEGSATGMWQVNCEDCRRIFSFSYDAAPKWAKKYIDFANVAFDKYPRGIKE